MMRNQTKERRIEMKPEEIKALRKERELTQIALAVRVGVSLMSVQLWERGGTKPSQENLERLKHVLGVE